MRRYTKKKEYHWSAPIAYSVGLMASDGCLSRDGRHIDLTSVDVEQLENFCFALNRKVNISPKNHGRPDGVGRQGYRVQFSDVAYYDFLLEVGLTPHKSKTIGSLKVPTEYYNHFLRGLFDGDGSCYAYFDLRWKNSYMYYVTFVSASFEFMSYIQSMNMRLLGVGKGSLHVYNSVCKLSYAKKDAKVIYRAMYKDKVDFYLPRKYVKLRGFIQKEENVIMSRNARVVERQTR